MRVFGLLFLELFFLEKNRERFFLKKEAKTFVCYG
jgi:hypothetical protein